MDKWLCGLCIDRLRKELDGKHRATKKGYCHKCAIQTDLHKVK